MDADTFDVLLHMAQQLERIADALTRPEDVEPQPAHDDPADALKGRTW